MKRGIFFFGVVFFLISCNKLEQENPESGSADFTSTIALGGNFLSGYTNGALYQSAQEKSLANLIAQQLALAGGGEFNQSLVADKDGLGLNLRSWDGDFHTKSILGNRTDCEGEVSFGPVKTVFNANETGLLQNTQGVVNNFAIPYAEMHQWDNMSLGNLWNTGNDNPYYARFASNPGTSTLLEDALEREPTFAILWLGMEEIYNFAMRGGVGPSIPAPENTKIDSLLAALSAMDVKGAIATIPKLESFPYFNLIPSNGANLSQGQADSLNDGIQAIGPEWEHINFEEGENGFVFRDTAFSAGYAQMETGEKLLFTVPLDSIKCHYWGLLGAVIPDVHSLDYAELDIIQSAITEYNSYITQKAREYDFALVDMHDYFEKVGNGIIKNGVSYNLDFISGGFISLDGYHPTEQGYGLIANEYITAINAQYGATVPYINCLDCESVQFPDY